MKNVLAIGAHPDDIEYGCGGTLYKNYLSGDNVYLFIATGGECGGDKELRNLEQTEACRLIGCKGIFWGEFSDTKLGVNNDLIKSIEEAIKISKPDIIYVNYFDDYHQDHRSLSRASIAAARKHNNILYYETYSTNKFIPSVFSDISDCLEKKLEIIKSHKSQLSKFYPLGSSILEATRSIAVYRGFQSRLKYAEGFKPLRMLI